MAYASKLFRNIYMRHWRKKHRERENAQQRARYHRDPERFKASNRRYYERHAEELKEKRRRRYAQQRARERVQARTIGSIDRSPHRAEIERYLASGGRIQRFPDQTPWALGFNEQIERLESIYDDETGAA